MEKKPLLLLFDGNAIVHRAYHALPPLTVSRTGEMVNAVYGFASMLLKALNEIKPTHWAIAFDRPGLTFRHQKFEDYKAHRPPTPEDLISQLEKTHELVQAFRIPIYEMDGFEADDVLATLSKQSAELRIDTLIVTGDKDILQAVSERVKVLAPRKGFSDIVTYGEEEVRERFGVSPQQLVELKTLMGDPSDNIPGIPSIGEKTATKLIQQFGSVEELYQRIQEVIPERLRGTLIQYKDQALLNHELAKSVTDVPLKLDLEACKVSGYDREKAVELFRALEFSKLLIRLPYLAGEAVAPAPVAIELPGVNYRIVRSAEDLAHLVQRLSEAKEFVFDVETSSLDAVNTELVGISLTEEECEAVYIPVGHYGLMQPIQLDRDRVIQQLKPVFEDARIAKIAHNGKFDMTVLAQYGIKVANLKFDTMIAACLMGEKALGLKALAFNRLGIEMTAITELIGTGAKQVSMATVDAERACDYACADVDICLRLKRILEAELKDAGLWQLFSEVEMPLVPVLADMEQNGVALDVELLREMSQSLGKEMANIEAAIYNTLGHQFNINSSKQLSEVLYTELKLPKARKTKSGYSTDASVLDELKGAHPIIELILQYRQLTKLKSTYVDALPQLVNPKTGRLHTSFNQTGTTTGRLSSSEPNLQNIPIRSELGRKIRQAIIAPPGSHLLAADYSQIDLRVLAHLSQDPDLIKAFQNDEDIHKVTASKVFNVEPSGVTSEMRRVAKTVNFGVIYGMSEFGLEQATDLTREQAGEFITSYFFKYPMIREYLYATKEQARRQGFVQTLLGRRRYIPEINAGNRVLREAAERMAINMPVQGTSADIIKVAMVQIHSVTGQRGLKSKMILQVHDELVFEVPDNELEELKAVVSEIMPKAVKLIVPIKIDIKLGCNWAEME